MKSTTPDRVDYHLLNLVPIGMLVLRHDMVVQFWNRCLEEWTGVSSKAIVGKSILDLFSHLGEKRYALRFEQVFETGITTIFSSRLHGCLLPSKTSSGRSRIQHTTVTRLPDSDHGQSCVLLSIEDVTDLTHRIREFRTMRDEADKASRIKSEFLANMSHEIRTPLNGVIGMAELLFDTHLNAEQFDYVKTLKSSGKSLLELVNDIMDLSKIEADQLVLESIEFDLPELFDQIISPLAVHGQPKGLELHYRLGDGVRRSFIGDPTRLRQILTNLAGNAVKFTGVGHVVLSVLLEAENDESQTLKFSVDDTGIGIPSDKLQTIFEPFLQADGGTTRRYGGTGLGLAISNTLVTKMGGSLDVQSVMGQGSTFSFTISMQKNLAESETDDRCSLPGRTALILDDCAPAVQILEEMLARRGFVVHTASETAMVENGPYSIVIVDHAIDGLEDFLDGLQKNPACDHSRIILSRGRLCRVSPVSAQHRDLPVICKPFLPTDVYRCVDIGMGDQSSISNGADGISDLDSPVRRMSVLVAEDNPVGAKVVVSLLSKRGHDVTVVVTGKQAVEAVRNKRFDVVLMDCQMPEMDGYEATASIRALQTDLGYHVPIVALTANAIAGDRQRCLDAGMDSYLTKPIRLPDLFEVVEDPEAWLAAVGSAG